MPKLKTQTTEPKTSGDLRMSNTRAQLFSFVQRLERLDEERRALGDDMKEVRGEAGAMGFSVKTINTVLQRRRKDKADLVEADSTLELYESVIAEVEADELQQSKDDAE